MPARTERARALAALFDRHRPRDAEEAAHLARMRALVELPADPFSRDHFVPGHFTASAFILSPGADALLLIHHAKLDRWLQPGGHVDAEDTSIIAAARREMREEVGLDAALESDAIFDVDVHEIPPLNASPAHAHFDVRFLFRAPSLAFTAASDAKAGKWVKLAEIDAELSDRSVLRAVEKLR